MNINLTKYVGGQLKMNLTPCHRGIPNVVTYRGEIDEIELDGRQVRVELRWVAKTTDGQYALDTQFDLDVDFEVRRVIEDETGNLSVITEQGEEMSFFMVEDESNIKVDAIVGFCSAPESKTNVIISESPARGPMIRDIRVNYVDGSFDLFKSLDGNKNVIGCYESLGQHFENQSPDNAIPSKGVAQYLFKVSHQGNALNETEPLLETIRSEKDTVDVDKPTTEGYEFASRRSSLPQADATQHPKTFSVLAFLAIWLLPLFGMLLVQGDGPPAGGGPISIWGIWFLSIPLITFLYKKYTSSQER